MQGHIHRRQSQDRAGRPKSLWYVVIDVARGPDGRRRQKWHGSYPTRAAAEAARAEIIHRWYGGSYVEPSKLTLEEWMRESWLPTLKSRVKPSTWHSYYRNCELHLLPRLGRYPIQKLTPGLIDSAYQELKANGRRNRQGGGLSLKTIAYLHTILHASLRDAVDKGVLQQNPATQAKPPKPQKASPAEMRCWTPSQLRQFLTTIRGERLEAGWHLAAMTGMRRGEVLALRWSDIDFDARRLSVRRSFITFGAQQQMSTPKTHKARTVDLDPGTVNQLCSHRRRQDLERATWGGDYEDLDLVFCLQNGTPLSPESFSNGFIRAASDAGLPRIRLHDLRHTHASIALAAGVPLPVVAERLGHSRTEYTLKTYAHALPGMQAVAAETVAVLVQGAD